MASALDNLKANMEQQGMLGPLGDLPQYIPYWLRGTEYGVPSTIPIQLGADIYNRGGGSDSSVITDVGEPRTDAQSFRDWWNLDNDLMGTRDLVSAAGFITGAGMFAGIGKQWGDSTYGVNPLANTTSMLGAMTAIPYATNMQEAIALSKTGAFAGDLLGNSLIGNTIVGEYISPYTEGIKDSPWHEEASAMGLEQGTKQYDSFINAVSGGLAKNRGVDPEMMEAYDRRGEERWRDTSYIKSLLGEEKDPESVGDFGNMFTSISNNVSDWWDNLTGDIDDIDDQRGFEYDIYEKGYGQQGDDTWQDKTGITYHGKGFNWNNSGGPSGDGDSSSGPTEGTDEHDEASANADGTWD